MKILASDFDLTLYVDEVDVVSKNVDAIRHFMRCGNLFCIVTGRNYSSIKVLLEKYQIPYHYLMCQDGAKIFDYNDYCFSTVYLAREKINKVLEVIKKYPFSYYLDDGYNQTENMDDCVKVVVEITDHALVEEMLLELKDIDVYSYISREHVNIIDSSVNKKLALEKVLVHADCSRDDLYVIGDSINDLEMIDSFHGAVMESHSSELDSLTLKKYATLYQYIEELEKN